MKDQRPRAGDTSEVVSAGLICLAPADNILIATRSIASGEEFIVDGETIVVPQDVPIGYKIARYPLEADAEVVRFGMPIGRITRPVRPAELVHTHNLASTYLPPTRRRSQEE